MALIKPACCRLMCLTMLYTDLTRLFKDRTSCGGGGNKAAAGAPPICKNDCVTIVYDAVKKRAGGGGQPLACANNIICISIPHCKHGDDMVLLCYSKHGRPERKAWKLGGAPPTLQTTRIRAKKDDGIYTERL